MKKIKKLKIKKKKRKKAVMTKIFVPWCQSGCSLPTGLSVLELPLLLFFAGKELPNYSHWKWKWKSLSHDCNSMDCSLPGSSVHGILQARILEWVVIPYSRDPPNQGIEPRSPTLQVDSSLSEPPGKPNYSHYGGGNYLMEQSKCRGIWWWVNIL